MSHHIIEIKHLSYRYSDKTLALNDVNCTITHQESVAVIGANGAGKSTLLLHLNGILRASSGSVEIGHIPVTDKTIKLIRQNVGMIFQNPDDQLFMPTVFEDVAFGPLNMGLPETEVKRRVKDALSTVGLSHLAGKAPYHLSGGEKRGAAIATVLAMEPNILVLDEPSANLDSHARRLLIKQLQSFEHTKIIASHDLDMIAEVCNRVLILHKGTITADGAVDEIFRNGKLLSQYGLEPPLGVQTCPLCGTGKAADG